MMRDGPDLKVQWLFAGLWMAVWNKQQLEHYSFGKDVVLVLLP